MHLSVTIKNESVSKKVLEFLSAFKKEDVLVETLDEKPTSQESIATYAGMWQKREITLESLREAAWKK